MAQIELLLPSCLILWGGVKLVAAIRDIGRVPCPDKIRTCIKANTGDIQRRELVHSSTHTLNILERSGSRVLRSPVIQVSRSPHSQVPNPTGPHSSRFSGVHTSIPPCPQAPKSPGSHVPRSQVLRLQCPQVPERTLQLFYSFKRCRLLCIPVVRVRLAPIPVFGCCGPFFFITSTFSLPAGGVDGWRGGWLDGWRGGW